MDDKDIFLKTKNILTNSKIAKETKLKVLITILYQFSHMHQNLDSIAKYGKENKITELWF